VAARYRGRPDQCVEVARQILGALDYLEDRNLLHRDISPSNILVPDEDEDAGAKLIDFGLASFDAETKTAVGTPRYRAPEIDRGENWSPSCDLYSLGVVIFELLTGRLPYQIIDDVPQKQVPVLGFTPEEETMGTRVLDVLLEATRPDPARRFQNARTFLQALDDAEAPFVVHVDGW
jgi:serine/threonine-protein kinase PpkA